MIDDTKRIRLEGCYNFRDLGGYRNVDGLRVRHGHLFRSDALHHLTAKDIVHLENVIGLRRVIDVRSPGELQAEAPHPLSDAPFDYHHIPLFSETRPISSREGTRPDLAGRYLMILHYAEPAIAAIIDLLAHSPAPAVFHCAAGKDRTGLISALILDLLGVPTEALVRDYTATAQALPGIVERLRTSPSYKDVFKQLPADTLHAEAKTMSAFLERAQDEWGGLSGYARKIGVSEATIDQLRKRLLEAT